jgi:hypothetical protein
MAAFAAMGLGIALGTSCDSPSKPSPVVVPVALNRLELIAPGTIVPDGSVQLKVNGVMNDGSIEDMTSKVGWSSSRASVVQVSPTGLATGKSLGESSVAAASGRMRTSAIIFVLPDGTFRLRGTVKNSGFTVANVNVSVISGLGMGLSTVTNSAGGYTLYGVGGPVAVLFRKEGYLDSTRQLTLTSHEVVDLDMASAGPLRNYAGTYALTLLAGACGPVGNLKALPEELKRRDYTANVAQDGARLTFTLSDADFIVTGGFGNRFVGFIDGTDTITAKIGDAGFYYYYYGHFDIVERFGTGAFMARGSLSARGTPQYFSGDWGGVMMTSARSIAPFLPENTLCSSGTHGFVMVRR